MPLRLIAVRPDRVVVRVSFIATQAIPVSQLIADCSLLTAWRQAVNCEAARFLR